MYTLLYLTIFSAFYSVFAAEKFSVLVPPQGGEGFCSQQNVTKFNYNSTCTSPGATVILAANTQSYNALKTADINDPATAKLPAPMLEMSCTTENITKCNKVFPANRKLKFSPICILVKNTNLVATLNCSFDVDFIYENGSSAANKTSHAESHHVSTSLLILTGFAMPLFYGFSWSG